MSTQAKGQGREQGQTFLVAAADTLLGYTLITNLCLRPNAFIIALTNHSSETWNWRLLCTGNKELFSHVQPLHLNAQLSVMGAAEVVAKRWGRGVDVVVACPESAVDPRVLISGFGTALSVGVKIGVVRVVVEGWCGEFVRQMHRSSGVISVGIEVGEVEDGEMRERVEWLLRVMDGTTKRKGSGSVVKWS